MHACNQRKLFLSEICYLGAHGSLLHYCSYAPSNVHSYNLEPTAKMHSLFAYVPDVYPNIVALYSSYKSSKDRYIRTSL